VGEQIRRSDLNHSQVEALYADARRFVRPGVQNAEDALHDAFVELLEGKIQPDAIQRRTRQRVASEQSRIRRHRPLKSGPSTFGATDEDSRGPGAGQIGGFPYNSLKETTWS
jgi:hypothetical protein